MERMWILKTIWKSETTNQVSHPGAAHWTKDSVQNFHIQINWIIPLEQHSQLPPPLGESHSATHKIIHH